jgi:hypothetical protein
MVYGAEEKRKLSFTLASWGGRVILANGVSPSPKKITAWVELHTPGTAADLQQFICEMNSGASCPIWQGLSGTVPTFEKGWYLLYGRPNREKPGG